MNPVIKWLLVAFVVWWVIHDPAGAGHAVGRLGNLATQAATSLSTAVGNI